MPPTSGTPRRPAAARCSTWPPTASRPPDTSSARSSGSATCSPGATPWSIGERTTAEDNAVMLMRFEDGRAATIDVSWSSKGGLEGRFELYGDARPDRLRHRRRPPLRAFIERAGRLPWREDRRRHRLGLPGAERDLRPRARRDDGSHGRGVPGRDRAARDVRRRARGESRSSTPPTARCAAAAGSPSRSRRSARVR